MLHRALLVGDHEGLHLADGLPAMPGMPLTPYGAHEVTDHPRLPSITQTCTPRLAGTRRQAALRANQLPDCARLGRDQAIRVA